jgi:VanZ family protein
VWMGLLFWASTLSGAGGGLSIPDWVTHGTAYLVLAVLLARALAGAPRALTPSLAVAAVLLSTAYGVTDEYHQSFTPGRDPSLGDVAKDFGGATLGVLLMYLRSRGRQ